MLSSPHQRVYFGDTMIENFTLENNIERLPDTLTKIALGNRTNFYLNQNLILRTYYRFYTDDWGIDLHTFKAELAIKLGLNYTLYSM